MKIYTKVVLDWDGNVLEEQSYDYEGPLAKADMGGGGGDTTTTQKSEPWEAQKPYLQQIFKQAQALYDQGPMEYFPGNTVAEFTSPELQAQQRVLDYAQGGMQQTADAAMGSQQFLSGDVLRADSNPYLAGYAEGAIRPVFNQLTRQALPAVGSGAAAAGQTGSSRQGIAEGLAISDASQQALDTTSKIYSDAYGQGLDSMVKGLALAPQTMQAGLAPAQAMAGVGQQQREYDQALINEAINRYDFEQNAPWNNLAMFQNMIQGNYGGTGTMTTPGESAGQNIMGAAGAGLGAYGMMNMIPALGPVAPWAAGGMALLSLLS